MEIITLLIFISLLIAVGFLIAFLWNMKSGQYDDTYSPSVRMLFDDKPKTINPNNPKPAEGVVAESLDIGSGPKNSKGKSVL
jgi:cbb3-type cytochrome oxidase maturation protein